MDHFYWSLQAWLTYRFDALSAVSILVLTLVALYTHVSAGLTAFVLIAASQLVESTHALCKQYGQLEMDFTSVERLVEMLHVEHEPRGTLAPPAAWPLCTGDVVFENVTVRYAPHLPPALHDLSLTIKGGTSTAVIGRTGSGKSTLALALLATISPDATTDAGERGRILIDGVDLARVDKQALRTRVTLVAQDPVLFAGSMRLNLDPLGEYGDDECAAVLATVCEGHAWTLGTRIDGGGRNLSQGQRQLIGLARAILRRSAVVILDEVSLLAHSFLLSPPHARTQSRFLQRETRLTRDKRKRPPRPSTRRPRSACRRSCGTRCAAARSSPSRTASRPSGAPTASSCSTGAACTARAPWRT